MAPILLVAFTLVAVACGKSGNEQPDVVLITVDTLRADHIGAYGAVSTKTPRIDQLASEGMLLTQAATPMPLTRPAHFSLFTSLYPREHGVLNNALSLPSEHITLAERFRADGYATGAFTGVLLLGAQSGGLQGFEAFGIPTEPHRPANEVVPEALEWVSQQPADKPIFLWIHLFDPHVPYRPPQKFRSRVNPIIDNKLKQIDWAQLKAIARKNDGDIPAAVLQYALDLYSGEVEFTDYWVGRLLDGLEAMRSQDDMIVAFTADHGECFEHGVYFEHSDCLYDGAVSIPLILRHPETFTPGSRSSTPVSLVDLAPTILQAAGLSVPTEISGEPIQSLGPDQERYILLQYPMYQPGAANARSKKTRIIRSVRGIPVRPVLVDREMTGAVGSDWKLLRADGLPELYETGHDSTANFDRSAVELKARERMEETLDELLRKHPLTVLNPALINDDMRKTLEALGYIQADEPGQPHP